jgi:hypothetical protein
MLSKYVLDGSFTDGMRASFAGPLDVYLDEFSMTVGPPVLGISSKRLRITPFYRRMFFGSHYAEGLEIFEHGYDLTLAGTWIGAYETGGSPDGDFDIFKLENTRIRGTFGLAGLTVSAVAKSLPGSSVCYGSSERQENAHEPVQVSAEFVVPPQELASFLIGADYPIAGLYEGWFFRHREIAVGKYLVEGTDLWGFTVSRQGADPAALLDECVRDAHKRSKDRRHGFFQGV